MSGGRFVLLDRDGTVIVFKDYLSDTDEVVLLPGAADGMRRLRDMGLGLILITNQSAIGRGFINKARLAQIHHRLCALLKAEGVTLDAIYYCPHTPDDHCQCRKPAVGMVDQARSQFQFDPAQCFMIGDFDSDIELGRAIGAVTFRIQSPGNPVITLPQQVKADHTVDDLNEAADIIADLM